jgi:hypothetical protein
VSWASQFWKHNRDFLGNAAKNISPFLALTPLGIPGALIAGGLGRGIQHGANLGNIVKSGVSNAALGAGMQGGMGALRSAFNPSSSAASASFGSGAAPVAQAGQAAANEVPGYLGQAAINGADAGASAAGGAGSSLLNRIGSALGTAGKFAEAHPHTLEMGLGALDTSGRDYRNAQTNALNANTSMQQQQYEDYKKRMAALQPLLAAFAGQLQNSISNPYPVAGNPYR